jgi:hypothetical protein
MRLGCSSERSGKGCCLPLPRGDSGFQLAQAIGQQPQGAIQAHALVDALHGRVVWRRPFAARADRPPLVKFSCVRLNTLHRSRRRSSNGAASGFAIP